MLSPPCPRSNCTGHTAQAVIEAAGYDPQADVENTPDSVFCAHGAGFNVKWDQVKDYMHLESGLKEEKPPQIISGNLRADDRELERIMEREFGSIKRPVYTVKAENRPATEEIPIRPMKEKYLIVDGYNMIFSWTDLAALAREDIDAARRKLCDELSSYAGFTKCRLLVVFDGYLQKGSPGEKSRFHNIQVVYTREGETADAYIEKTTYELRKEERVRVVTSDNAEQLIILGHGALRVSAGAFHQEVESAEGQIADILRRNNQSPKPRTLQAALEKAKKTDP